nr:coat protein [Dragonfly associated cyclovirus]
MAKTYKRKRVVRRRFSRFAHRRKTRRSRYRKRNGNLYCKLTLVETKVHKSNNNEVQELHIIPSLFREYNNLGPSFESCTFFKARMTIIPVANVSNNSTSRLPTYTMFPWKKAVPIRTLYQDYLSIDRAKQFRGTQVGTMSFIPCVNLTASTAGDGILPVRQWRPTLQWNSSSEKQPNLYCGGACFQGLGEGDTSSCEYIIRTDVWVRFNRQSLMGS